MSDNTKATISAMILLAVLLGGLLLFVQWTQEQSVNEAQECIESGGEWLQTSTYAFVCHRSGQ